MSDVPQKPAPRASGMLPGMAMISIFMLVVALFGVFGAINGVWNQQGKYVVLPIATLLVVGVFGLLRLRRWGWAIVTAGSLLLSLGYLFGFTTTRDFRLIVMAGFGMVFFLYLIRTEVRDRVH